MTSLANTTTMLLGIIVLYHAIWLEETAYAARLIGKPGSSCTVDSTDIQCQKLKEAKRQLGNKPEDLVHKSKENEVNPINQGKTIECGATFSTETGTIAYPEISGSYYGNNEFCSWIVESSVPLYFYFSEFSTEIGYDLLIVRDGSSISAPLLKTLSGKSLSSTFITTGDAHITFTSDSNVISTGFVAHWRVYTSEEQCKDKNGTCVQTGDRCGGIIEVIENSCEDHCVCCMLGEDVNKCNENNGGCSHDCHYTDGSVRCSCSAGFSLDVDGKTCIDTDECHLNNGDCAQHCTNTEGSYDCSCSEGFLLGSNGRACFEINECDDLNGGCAHNCQNTVGSFICSCNPGYLLSADGRDCNDINECEDDNSGCSHNCHNTDGSFRCSCDSGYSLNEDGKTCRNINECDTNNGGCSQICHNTVGSFRCSCYAGYMLNEDGKSCVDINECEDDNGGCSHNCHNSDGSFRCSCDSGYSLNEDGKTCTNINECDNNKGGCSQVCHNTDGSFRCSCYAGYMLNEDGKSCVDIDECLNNNGGCDQLCINTEGSYECSCRQGFELDSSNLDCIDINECEVNNGGCSHNCHNSDGSFRCSCNSGYSLNEDGKTCTNINECDDNKGGCSQICHNTDGSFRCSCYAGYMLNEDGKSCIDVNECDQNNAGCAQVCQNTIGSYSCHCDSGYLLNFDGKSCNDIDECLTNNGGCSQQCTNTKGSYECSCHGGYSLSSNSKDCTDINECETNNGGCSDLCTNTDGSFICSCSNGYSLSNDGRSCTCSGFVCTSNGVCLDASTRCNSVTDCEDGSDEVDCDCSMVNDCDANAKCILPHGSSSYICQCLVGYAGNGKVCGPDQDLDGFPDDDLACDDTHCVKDNCPAKPNSGQEDIDNDGVGDACDTELPEMTPTLPPCDELVTTNCILDVDNDGIENSADNCPYVANTDQTNMDGDRFGDACDNCPNVSNDGQEDTDQDMVGDLCDTDNDRDKDGVQDDIDNCPDVPNPCQLNSDNDQFGDACDDDADDDGVPNDEDNCWLVYNPSQSTDDQCTNDSDDDGVPNGQDNCPSNKNLYKTDFRTFHQVYLDPFGTEQQDPVWVVLNDGAEISQTVNSDPGLVYGENVFNGVNFEGTFYVNDGSDDDYAGFIFSYQSNRRFYMMQWKRNQQEYWNTSPFEANGTEAITLKLVNSVTGPGPELRNAIWHNTGDVPQQTKLLWTDPQSIGWEPYVAYRWQLLHRPQIGLIRLRILKGATLLADSGNIFDNEIKGGRLGAFVFSQEDVIWSNLRYSCSDDVPESIYNDLSVDLQNRVNIDYSWNLW